ncbi:SufE family protein [Bacteroidota bacterium]
MSHPKTIAEREAEVVDEFSLMDDWMDRYAYLIDMGKALKPMNDAYKHDSFHVKGCQSNVWLRSWVDNRLLFFEAESDAMITKGLIALLIRVLSGTQPSEIMSARLEFLDEIGLRTHLSTNRSNGLSAMIAKMKSLAANVVDDKTLTP